jgi:hypothetical protein
MIKIIMNNAFRVEKLLSLGLILLMTLVPSSGAADPGEVDLGNILTQLGFKASDAKKLLGGEFLSSDPKESTDKELAVTVAAFMPAELSKVVDLVRKRKVYESDATILQYGDFGESPSAKDMEKLAYTGAELDELSNLIKSKPGSDFNLSQKEWDTIAGLGKTVGRKKLQSDPQAAAAVMGAYRDILGERAKAYLKGGLSAIAPYQRSGSKQASPADELAAALKSDFVNAKRSEEFLQGLQDFPKSQNEGMESQLFWIKQLVEKRPCVALVHILIDAKPTHAFVAQRQIFVGHNYNSLQILVGCLPVENGTVVFYRNRTSTDQVAGFGAGMRHKIGRGMMRDTILERFKNIRDQLK